MLSPIQSDLVNRRCFNWMKTIGFIQRDSLWRRTCPMLLSSKDGNATTGPKRLDILRGGLLLGKKCPPYQPRNSLCRLYGWEQTGHQGSRVCLRCYNGEQTVVRKFQLSEIITLYRLFCRWKRGTTTASKYSLTISPRLRPCNTAATLIAL